MTEDKLVKAAQNYALYCKSLEDKNYIKHASNFLRECVFEDYLEPEKEALPAKLEFRLETEEELIEDDAEWWRYGPNAWSD